MRVDAILFACDGRDYGVDVAAVSEVVRIDQISPVPLAPRVVVGAVSLDGKILPIIDVALIEGLGAQALSSAASGLRVRAGKYDLLLLASEVRGVRSLELPALEGQEGERFSREVRTSSGAVALLSTDKVGEAVERLFDGLAERRG